VGQSTLILISLKQSLEKLHYQSCAKASNSWQALKNFQSVRSLKMQVILQRITSLPLWSNFEPWNVSMFLWISLSLPS